MHSKRGLLSVIQTYPMRRMIRRRMLTKDIYGSTYDPPSEAEVRRFIPALAGGREGLRFPVLGGMFHPDAAVRRVTTYVT